MAENQFAVIGIGQFGEAIARSLTNLGAEVMAIDIDEELLNRCVVLSVNGLTISLMRYRMRWPWMLLIKKP